MVIVLRIAYIWNHECVIIKLLIGKSAWDKIPSPAHAGNKAGEHKTLKFIECVTIEGTCGYSSKYGAFRGQWAWVCMDR